MKVVISWSGDRSNKLAKALERFLSGIFPGIKMWISDQDIEPGLRWSEELSRILESSDFGVLCITPENMNAPWLLFEAGSIAKSVSQSSVVPYRLGVSSNDIQPPLALFQSIYADESGTRSLVESLNLKLERPLEETQLSSLFEERWPDLKSQISAILASANLVPAGEIDREQQRVRKFCARVSGTWWERIAEDGIGFFEIQMDELHNSVRLEGSFYDEEGSLVAYWNSAAARIEDNNKKGIVYLRECRHPAGNTQNWFHGYGDMWFQGPTESFSSGYGTFYDIDRDNPKMTLAKPVDLRRVSDTNVINMMQSGSVVERASLIMGMVSTW